MSRGNAHAIMKLKLVRSVETFYPFGSELMNDSFVERLAVLIRAPIENEPVCGRDTDRIHD